MRLFAALVPPPDVADELERLRNRIPVGRPVPRENLHLTLLFFGEVAATQAEALDDALSAIRAPRVEVTFTGLAALGDPAAVVAAEVRRTDAMDHLNLKLRGAAHAAGLRTGHDRFRPHVTLTRTGGRVVPDEETRLAQFLGRHGAETPAPFFAREIVLFRSSPGKHGSVYEALAEYPLA
jgi:2'-5' RNA ligase